MESSVFLFCFVNRKLKTSAISKCLNIWIRFITVQPLNCHSGDVIKVPLLQFVFLTELEKKNLSVWCSSITGDTTNSSVRLNMGFHSSVWWWVLIPETAKLFMAVTLHSPFCPGWVGWLTPCQEKWGSTGAVSQTQEVRTGSAGRSLVWKLIEVWVALALLCRFSA